jgi:hypothetical protein
VVTRRGKFLRRKGIHEKLQDMCSSLEEIDAHKYHYVVYCNLIINFQLNDLKECERWEKIFEEDNNLVLKEKLG